MADTKLVVDYVGSSMQDLDDLLDRICSERLSTLSAIQYLSNLDEYGQALVNLLTRKATTNNRLILTTHALFNSLLTNTYTHIKRTIKLTYSNYTKELTSVLVDQNLDAIIRELELTHFLFRLDARSASSLKLPSDDVGSQYILLYRRILAFTYLNAKNRTEVVSAKQEALLSFFGK